MSSSKPKKLKFIPPPEVKVPLPTESDIPQVDQAMQNERDKSTARRRVEGKGKRGRAGTRAPTILNADGE